MHRPALSAAVAAIAAAMLLMPATGASAAVIGYDIAWTGLASDTMIGSFSFDDAEAADGRIDGSELLTLRIEGFVNGVSFGRWDFADGLSPGGLPFNFNFDPIAEAFFVGGLTVGPSGQSWNALGNPGLGFASGTGGQALTFDGGLVGPLRPPFEFSLMAIRQEAAVPAPATLSLLIGGLALVACYRLDAGRRVATAGVGSASHSVRRATFSAS